MCDVKNIQGMPLTNAAKLLAKQIKDVINECNEESLESETTDQLTDLLEKLSVVRENARLLLLIINIRFKIASQNIHVKMSESNLL